MSISKEIRTHYENSGVFKTSPGSYIDKWYQMQEAIQHLHLNSLLDVGIGPDNQCVPWNGLFRNLFGISYFENIDIEQKHIDNIGKGADPLLANAQLCDVRTIDDVYSNDSFDVIFWSHGPEHILREEWKETFKKLEGVASKVVILQCPWGNSYDYDPEHVSKSITEPEFKVFGYCMCIHLFFHYFITPILQGS